MEEKKISCALTNSRMEPLHIEEALSLLDRVHLFAFQNEEYGCLQHAIEGIINTAEGITIRLKKQTSIFFFFFFFIFKCFL